MASRISRPALFMRLAYTYSLRSTCERGQVGAVIVKDKYVLSAGYNGAPSGMKDCFEAGCDLEHGDEAGCQRTVHAEANAVAHTARLGIQVRGGFLYCTYSPCRACAQLLVAAGINAVIYDRAYRRTPWDDLREMGLAVVQIGDMDASYEQ